MPAARCGWRATWSASRTWRACWMSPRPSPAMPRAGATGCRCCASTATRRHSSPSMPTPEADQRGAFYLLDADNPTSVQTVDPLARENARTLRALISTEMWLQINVFHGQHPRAERDRHRAGGTLRRLRDAEGRRAVAHRHHRGHVLSRPVLAFLHDGPAPGARRPDHAADRHQVQCAAADRPRRMPRSTPAQWNALLRAAAGYHAYRREYPHGYVPREVAGFLLLNTAFPRSAGLNLAQLDWHLTQLRSRYNLRGCTRPWRGWTICRRCWPARRSTTSWAAGCRRSWTGCSARWRRLHGDIMSEPLRRVICSIPPCWPHHQSVQGARGDGDLHILPGRRVRCL